MNAAVQKSGRERSKKSDMKNNQKGAIESRVEETKPFFLNRYAISIWISVSSLNILVPAIHVNKKYEDLRRHKQMAAETQWPSSDCIATAERLNLSST